MNPINILYALIGALCCLSVVALVQLFLNELEWKNGHKRSTGKV